MRIQQLDRHLHESITYPTDGNSVCDVIGSLEIDAPATSQTLTIRTLLLDHEDERFDNPNELFQTIMANLPEGYVGRKYYSDRGGHVQADVDGWGDVLNQSF